MATRKNILVIGENGFERRSVVNLIFGAKVSINNHGAGPSAVTHVNFNDDYDVIDMVGFNANSEASTSQRNRDTMVRLVERSLSGGLSLILFVIRKGPINANTMKNYDYFVNTFAQGEVPVVIVVTHCNGEKDYSVETWTRGRQQADAEAERFWSKADFADIVWVSYAKRKQGKRRLKTAIKNSSLIIPWKPNNVEAWALAVIKVAAGFVGGALLVKALISVILNSGVAIGIVEMFSFFNKLNLNRFTLTKLFRGSR